MIDRRKTLPAGTFIRRIFGDKQVEWFVTTTHQRGSRKETRAALICGGNKFYTSAYSANWGVNNKQYRVMSRVPRRIRYYQLIARLEGSPL